ncbi:unnamed protein product, partial [Mycena citricolor]
ICQRGHAGVLNGNSVERLEAVDKTQASAIFLDDAEPTGTVRRIRRLVHSRGHLLANQLADLVIDTGRNWFEEVGSKFSSFKRRSSGHRNPSG